MGTMSGHTPLVVLSCFQKPWFKPPSLVFQKIVRFFSLQSEGRQKFEKKVHQTFFYQAILNSWMSVSIFAPTESPHILPVDPQASLSSVATNIKVAMDDALGVVRTTEISEMKASPLELGLWLGGSLSLGNGDGATKKELKNWTLGAAVPLKNQTRRNHPFNCLKKRNQGYLKIKTARTSKE